MSKQSLANNPKRLKAIIKKQMKVKTMAHIADELNLTVGNLKAKYYPSSINKWLLADEIRILELYGDK